MISVACRTIADDLRIYFCAPSLRAFEFFEHINPRAFAKHHPRTIAREWARRTLRLVIPFSRQDGKQIKAGQNPRRQWSIDASGDHHILTAEDNVLRRVCDRVS